MVFLPPALSFESAKWRCLPATETAGIDLPKYSRCRPLVELIVGGEVAIRNTVGPAHDNWSRSLGNHKGDSTNILAFGTFPFCVRTGSRSEWLIPWLGTEPAASSGRMQDRITKSGDNASGLIPIDFLHRVVSKTVHYKRRAPRALTRYATGGRTARQLGSVSRAAGNNRYDETNWTGRIVLRPGEAGDVREGGSSSRQMQELSTAE